MIDNNLLEELVTFAKYHTLSATAKHLMLTQPSVTRGMQRLEEELGVKLFDRQSNQIALNKTGEFAVGEAAKVLKQNRAFIDRVKNFDQSHRVIKIGSNAPGPIYVLQELAKNTPNIAVEEELIADDAISESLLNNKFSFTISNHEIQDDRIESYYLNTEELYVNLDQFMFQANQSTITFKELSGLSFIVLQAIGPWKDVIQDNIPNAKFLYQAEREALAEITNYSNFPYFTTTITRVLGSLTEGAANGNGDSQVAIPISDPQAKMDFYLNYLKDQRKQVPDLAKQIRNAWP